MAAPEGPSIFIVPTCCVCAGEVFKGVESKFDWKIVSLEQPENITTIRSSINTKYGLYHCHRLLNEEGAFIQKNLN